MGKNGRARTTEQRDQAGSAAVELALILPLLLLLVSGIIDFGRMLNVQLTLSSAAREGARWAALNQTSPSPAARAQAVATADGVTATVSVTGCSTPPAPNTNATVIATNAYSPITPIRAISTLLGGSFPATITLTGRGVMRCGG